MTVDQYPEDIAPPLADPDSPKLRVDTNDDQTMAITNTHSAKEWDGRDTPQRRDRFATLSSAGVLDGPTSEFENRILKRIPQEIIDQFIDHLHDDEGALRTCGLVCRAWVPSSRYHLFDIVFFCALDIEMEGRFSGLIGYLEHPLCTFASSVRTLFITTLTDHDQDPPLCPPPTWADPLIPCLSKLVSVKTLVANSIGGRRFGWDPLFKSTPFITRITCLYLESPDFTTFEDCMDTICSFPSLESLEYNPNFRNDEGCILNLPVSLGSPSPPPSLRILHMHSLSSSSQLIWQWLHQTQTRLSVIKLARSPSLDIQAYEISTSKFSTFTQYLQFLGPSLEVLQAVFEDVLAISLFLDNVDLTLNTGLRILELEIGLAFYVEAQSFDGELSLLPSFLSRLPTLTCITFNVRKGYKTNPRYGFLAAEEGNTITTWMTIDSQLSGPTFPALTEVVFNVLASSDGFVTAEYFESKLARCKRKGVLRISSGEW